MLRHILPLARNSATTLLFRMVMENGCCSYMCDCLMSVFNRRSVGTWATAKDYSGLNFVRSR
ncbi:hypothetical protein OIU84_025572 [Salix udensis]|uniref:Uncharacterized protein n=1 Tax=Salix udensis TaxID=889485 RepID=A0AAD6PDS7_9ROSI|nr:hypothetical protein OIU84_025572 [Salix udensis]